jgi:ribosome-binding factor A
MRGNKSRGARVNSDVQRVISHIIEFELKDPRVSSLVSVVKCDVTNDLKECKCYISVLGSEEDGENTLKGLVSASGFIRKRLAESLNLRYTPVIEFKLDKSIEYGVMMSKKIDDIISGDQ